MPSLLHKLRATKAVQEVQTSDLPGTRDHILFAIVWQGYFIHININNLKAAKFSEFRICLNFMPDSFFTTSKPRKRKHSTFGVDGGLAGSSKKIARKVAPSREFGLQKHAPNTLKVKGQRNGKKWRTTGEELSDQTGEEDGGGIDDMDLRADSDADAAEDDDETPAEKRLRLAKLYLESVKEGLGESSQNFPTAM